MNKKIKLLITTIISILILLFGAFNANAQTYIEDTSDFPNASAIGEVNEGLYNIMKGYDTYDEIINSSYMDFVRNNIYKYVYCITFWYDFEINIESTLYTLEVKVESDSHGDYIEVFFDRECIYNVHIDENGENFDLYTNKEITLESESGYIKFQRINRINDKQYEIINAVYKEGYSESDLDFSTSCAPIILANVEDNKLYDGDIYLVMPYDELLSIDEILDNISIYDETDEYASFKVLESEYKEEEKLGNYKMLIMAYDTSANITTQEIIISVIDINGPSITTTPIDISYTKEITDYTDLYNIYDISNIQSVKIDDSNYINNKNIPGEYKIKITAIDEYDNESINYININVIDDISPIITIPNNLVITTLDNYSLNKIKSLCSSYDAIDGDIELDIDDIDNYTNNTRKVGNYSFKLTSIDNSDNIRTTTLIIKVMDKDSPVININSYTIIVPHNYQMSIAEIKEALINVGQIEEENVSLESEYFNNDELDSYTLLVQLDDGKVLHDVISKTGDGISYEIPIEVSKESNNYTPLIISLSLAGIIVATIITLSIVYYKKRH